MVERLNAAHFEHLMEECLAECGGEVIDKTGNSKIVIAYDDLVCVEYLTDLKSYLSLLERACKLLYAGSFLPICLDVFESTLNALVL